MKGVVFYNQHDVRYQTDVAEPQIEHPTQVKIKPRFCGICGSDLHEYEEGPILFQCPRNPISDKPYQQCMGHEMCGEVVAVGSAVTDIAVGDQVVVEATASCIDRALLEQPGSELCEACAHGKTNACHQISFVGLGFMGGGFAEYCVVDQYHCVKYDPDVIPNDIAALVEPLSVAWHAIEVAKVKPSHSALVLGAGPIGLCVVLALKAQGLRHIVVSEPAPARRALANSFGAIVYDPTSAASVAESDEALRQMSAGGLGYDRAYDCSGIPVTFNCMVQSLRSGGVGTNVAIWPPRPVPLMVMDLTLRERFIVGSMCYTRADFESVVAAFEAKKFHPEEVRQLVTKVVPLPDTVSGGFDELLKNRAAHIKILIDSGSG
ncbi:hypothetical protein DIURU_001509 [Diutina rugosa]|uniref:Enoyl reductase (ER) domain-containing protein n=1 Tax=Diutina rugosa TaxID=5481 RepID=A0A642UT81_DIURU|nr:uncharacterized protein DIURU_001509 [Diutina rugosa]KAA8905081.1 hypothetical protein DIURU_001509 [Diutina rugosa]